MTRPYDRPSLKTGIVHLGVGAFHRAHQAVYTEQVLQQYGGDWGICGVSLRRPDVRDSLATNNNIYHVAVKSSDAIESQSIGALLEVLVALEDPARVVAKIASPCVHVITLTITEKGYCLHPASGELDLAHPDTVHDLANPAQPRGAIGFLVAGLASRRAAGNSGLTIISCDNLSANGRKLQAAVQAFAGALDLELARWIGQRCSFPCSMVDRIVPATSAADIAALEQQLGLADDALVVTEPFSQWVIENNFAGPVPPWNEVGAEYVENVEPFEQMKLRLLNASHSTMAYLGCLAGYETVADVMDDPAFVSVIEQLMTEMASTLSGLGDFNVDNYRGQLLQRFANRGLEHRTQQIAMDGSQKIPQRLLPAIAQRLSRREPIEASVLGLAAWICYTMGADQSGRRWQVSDPLAQTFAQLTGVSGADLDAYLDAVLALESVFPAALRNNETLRTQLSAYIHSLTFNGTCATVAQCCDLALERPPVEETA